MSSPRLDQKDSVAIVEELLQGGIGKLRSTRGHDLFGSELDLTISSEGGVPCDRWLCSAVTSCWDIAVPDSLGAVTVSLSTNTYEDYCPEVKIGVLVRWQLEKGGNG